MFLRRRTAFAAAFASSMLFPELVWFATFNAILLIGGFTDPVFRDSSNNGR